MIHLETVFKGNSMKVCIKLIINLINGILIFQKQIMLLDMRFALLLLTPLCNNIKHRLEKELK